MIYVVKLEDTRSAFGRSYLIDLGNVHPFFLANLYVNEVPIIRKLSDKYVTNLYITGLKNRGGLRDNKSSKGIQKLIEVLSNVEILFRNQNYYYLSIYSVNID